MGCSMKHEPGWFDQRAERSFEESKTWPAWMRRAAGITDQITTNIGHPEAIKWNPFNKVVQDHRDGVIDHRLTNIERAKRGLPVPWTPKLAESEVSEPEIE